MRREYLDAIKGNRDYTDFLSLMGSLSNLFADSTTPFIHYRIVENLFCKCFEAENLARFDDSYDAKKWEAGSGLNQWNAGGRARDPDEVYIPVPMRVHELNPGFFPERDVVFALKLPNGTTLSAKMCQQGRKGLMSNPNRALGRWILRDVLHIPPWRIVTREMLDTSGFDSVVVVREAERQYRLELSRAAHYLAASPRTIHMNAPSKI